MIGIRVIIGIISFRSAALTIECLQSIESDRCSSEIKPHVVVVDNASGDAPAILAAIEARSWSTWVSLIVAPKNGGFSYGNNLALQHAASISDFQYFHMLNPDTVIRPGAISALAYFLERHPDVGIAGSSFENLDGSEWPFAFRFPSMASEIEGGLQFGLATRILRRRVGTVRMSSTPQVVDWVPGASMMIRRSVFESIGGFDEHYFLYFEETDFCLRAKRAGFSTWYIPESRVMHIAGQSTSVTKRDAPPTRLPAYWFDSRRRYFTKAYGPQCAMVIDASALVAHLIGYLKLVLQRRTDRKIPYFLVDLYKHSMFWPKNWSAIKWDGADRNKETKV
jgi:N-acetylglucosaminyl-diphospho-decaprenol L-rhamnosyltransferase